MTPAYDFATTGTLSPDPAVAKAQKAEHKKASQRENVLKLQHSRGPIPRGRKPIAKENSARRERRRKAFRQRLGRADWKALRLACFARDGWQCRGLVRVPSFSDPKFVVHDGTIQRCPYVDESQTGKGLVADHKTYARFGHENLDDLRTLCRSCNAKATRSERANHAAGFRR
jgi:5-methylcytosine-specific restriction endonuclease McrA